MATLAVTIFVSALAIFLHSKGYELLAGALMGAAVSTFVASLIAFLQTPDDPMMRPELITAARREMRLSGYYRDRQEIEIAFTEASDEAKISLTFRSRIIPTRDGETVINYTYPDIVPPNSKYKITSHSVTIDGGKIYIIVDGKPLPRGRPNVIKGPTDELIEIQYEVLDSTATTYSDEHIWRTPVMDYDVQFKVPSNFVCKYMKG